MKKTYETKSEKAFFKAHEQEQERVNTEVSLYYPNGSIAGFTPSSVPAPFASLIAQAKEPPAQTQEQLCEQCHQILALRRQGNPGNYEIQLNKGRQFSGTRMLPLGNTVLKLRPIGGGEPYYYSIMAGDKLEASIFIGGDNVECIMVVRDENGEDNSLRLSEFHMLSLQEDPDPRNETGLMTSFIWLCANAYSSVISGANLYPIKSLLLSEWLHMEWKRAKDAASQSSSEIVEGKLNG